MIAPVNYRWRSKTIIASNKKNSLRSMCSEMSSRLLMLIKNIYFIPYV